MAEAEGGSEQDDVSFLRTVWTFEQAPFDTSIYNIYCYWFHVYVCGYAGGQQIDSDACLDWWRVNNKGRHGLSVMYSNRWTCLSCGRRLWQSSLFLRKYCRQKYTARFIAMRLCHRTGIVRTCSTRIGHRCRFRIRMYWLLVLINLHFLFLLSIVLSTSIVSVTLDSQFQFVYSEQLGAMVCKV